MRASSFTSTRFGELETDRFGSWPFPYFMPAMIPREIELDSDTHAAVSRADIALGRLSGLAMLIDDPELLLAPSMMQEALSSSRIEGTQASLSDVLSAASAGEPVMDADLQEVSNYLDAAKQGRELLHEWPLTGRFFCALHETLLTGSRGEEKYPGELRRSPVWIGSPNARPETARFIPPHQNHIGDLLSDWEKFVNEPSNMPPVIRAALAHYQFETIHPFLDGNGRIGRLLIGFGLMLDDVLPAPILPISGYFEQTRHQYYERLQAVRERGEIDEWIQFFCAAVEQQASLSSARIRALVEIRERYRKETRQDRTALVDLVELIFTNPVVTTTTLMRFADVTRPTATSAIKRAVGKGWLRSGGKWGVGGRERWIATEIWDAVSTEPSSDEFSEKQTNKESR